MSRRTETAYKAKCPGKSAQHDKAQGLGDMVNAVVAWGKFTLLYGEICPACGQYCYGSRSEDHPEKVVIEPPDPKAIQSARYAEMHNVTGQKSA